LQPGCADPFGADAPALCAAHRVPHRRKRIMGLPRLPCRWPSRTRHGKSAHRDRAAWASTSAAAGH